MILVGCVQFWRGSAGSVPGSYLLARSLEVGLHEPRHLGRADVRPVPALVLVPVVSRRLLRAVR